MTFNRYRLLFVALICGLIFIPVSRLHAQKADNPQAQAQSPDGQNREVDPLKRERSDKEKIASQKAVRQELKGAYKTWLEQDVSYIISDEERRAFRTLSNDEERDAFIENFWLRRNPNPDSPENEFREEHYRRIAYANEHYPAGKPGWKTDRGRIYISWGPPDSIDSHPSGGSYQRPIEEGGGSTLISSLWIPASAATTTSLLTAARRTRCCTFPAPAPRSMRRWEKAPRPTASKVEWKPWALVPARKGRSQNSLTA
jgi:GWxTD domain-containing protein